MLRIWRCDCALCVIGNEFPCTNHTIPPPPSHEGYPFCPKDKNRSPFHGAPPDDNMVSWKEVVSNLPKRFCMARTRHFASAPNN